MGLPALQLMGDRFSTSGAWGTSAWGTSPWGGQDYVPVTLPPYHLGSDDLQQKHRQLTAEIVHKRNGVPVSVRPYHSWNLWHVEIKMIDESDLPDLRTIHAARVCNLLPAGEGGEVIPVHWVQPEFRPIYIKPGVYSLEFDLEEIPT